MEGLRYFASALVALALAVPASAAVQANAAGHLVADTETRGVRVVDGEGGGLLLALPARAQVWELARLQEGWVATTSDGGTSGRLVVHVGDRATSRTIPVPPPVPGAMQRRGIPLVDQGVLVGLAWLEGSPAGGHGVRIAELGAEGFVRPQWVSRPGAGSQMGLAATVLDDGGWLLVWSAFDGVDDEIVAARRVAGAWTAPSRIGRDNRVPDITPAVAATPGGALAVWSRYDGERYSLVRARLEQGAWHEQANGEPGLYPSFRGGGESPILLYFVGARPGWSALRLDARGSVLARADAPGPSSGDTPVLESSADGIALRAAPSSPAVVAPWKRPR